MSTRIGIDTGGTFTDLIAIDEATDQIIVSKCPSTPQHPEQGVFDSLTRSGVEIEDISFLILGSTIAINTLHQRAGARVLYLTTQGFEDVLFIQRINRKFHYDLDWVKPAPFVERRNCIGVKERINKDGQVLTALDDEELTQLRSVVAERLAESDGATAIAVNFLFGYANPIHEEQIGDFLRYEFPGIPVSLSHRVAPIWREYERGSTTTADAYIKPLVANFATNLDKGFRERGVNCTWALMKSNGGNMVAEAAAEQPVQLLLSGLAGGIIAGRTFGELVGSRNVITLDMGGTSTDVGIVIDGEYGYTTEYQVEWGIPVAAPLIDLTTIGAGGGSIAWIDKGGFLKVGSQSAGADPGPACYDAGGLEATVTDANIVLGRLNPDYFLGGRMSLKREKAAAAVAEIGQKLGMGLEETALAITELANENMANAIRLITVERGIDPREFDLVAFGGAGALHAVALAESVGVRRVIVPPHAGLASAFGTLLADLRVDRSWTHAYRSNQMDVARIEERFKELTESALADLRAEGFTGTPTILRSISMRYLGQNYEQDVSVSPGPITDATIDEILQRFHDQHESFYGYSIPSEIMELIHFNVSVIGETPKVTLPRLDVCSSEDVRPRMVRQVYFQGSGFIECPIYRREDLFADAIIHGPAIVEEEDSTVVLSAGRQLLVTKEGILCIEK
ncbi:hydantoinase/oxoprolinase family protein [Chloroflexi bacterium TSY]|nr:hydantoinase/oxoprolinase family protein [Chloroflexi bacterium TSY]